MEYWWALPSRVRLPPQQMHFATILAMREARIPLLTLDKNVFHGGAHVIAFPCLGWTLSWSKTNLYTAPGWSLQHSTEREENQKTIWPQRESNPPICRVWNLTRYHCAMESTCGSNFRGHTIIWFHRTKCDQSFFTAPDTCFADSGYIKWCFHFGERPVEPYHEV